MRLLAAPDKFRGTVSANDASLAILQGAQRANWQGTLLPLSDGGEGFRELFPGSDTSVSVHGPLGENVIGSIRLNGSTAVIEMADAAGRALLLDPQDDDSVSASTEGVGELILAAHDAGATTIIVGCGGSATSDGGLGAVQVLDGAIDLTHVTLIAACDVTTKFLDAAKVFGSQKGASQSQIDLLTQRLNDTSNTYRQRFGIDVGELAGSGAAGGLAGGLAALGAKIISGFDVLAEAIDLDDALTGIDLLVTGEGRLDESSLHGKTVGSLLSRLKRTTPVFIVAGQVAPGLEGEIMRRAPGPCRVIDLTQRVGEARAQKDTSATISEVVAETLTSGWPGND